ncbi:MAG: DUF2341 domain-containing protein [Candidatus Thermoplasmatota archaeon]
MKISRSAKIVLFVLVVNLLVGTLTMAGIFGKVRNDAPVSENASLPKEAKGAGWYNSSWQYRKPITIAEQSGTALIDYQVLLTIDTASLISVGKMQSDGDDIRFTDANNIELSYWIESGINTTTTKIWVKVPNIPASGTSIIYTYYGNPNASGASNGNSTFEFFDNFEGDLSKWIVFGSHTHQIVIIDGVKAFMVYGNNDGWGDGVKVNINLSADLQLACRFRAYDTNIDHFNMGICHENGLYYHSGIEGSYTNSQYFYCTPQNDSDIPLDTNWHIGKVAKFGGKHYYFLDNESYFSFRDDSSEYNQIRLGAGWGSGYYGAYFDWVALKKYVSLEPTASIGAEEQFVGLPDLTLTSQDISFSSPNPLVDETIKISATVWNIGNGNVSDPPDYVARWRFDEGSGATVHDDSVNYNNGSIIGTPSWTAGKYGSALYFDGAKNQYVEVPTSSSLNITSAITIEAWALLESVEYYYGPGYDAGGQHGVNPRLVSKGAPADQSNQYELLVGHLSANITFILAGVTYGNVTYGTTPKFPLGVWTHIAATYDGKEIKIYLNGELKYAQEATGNISTTAMPLRIGAKDLA